MGAPATAATPGGAKPAGAKGALTSGAAAGQPTEGTLATREGKRVIEVPLAHTEVTIRARGHLADVEVVQSFVNPFPRKIEAVYMFPLPTGAAVNAMRIKTGTQTIEGQIQPRAEATRLYRAARARGQVAALLTQERPNLFTQSVANLEPGARIDVTLRYVQALDYDDGGYEIVFPMVAGPRYVPARQPVGPGKTGAPASGRAGAPTSGRADAPAPGQADAPTASPGTSDPDADRDPVVTAPVTLPPGARSGHDIGLTVDLDAGVPISNVRSPSHLLVPTRAPASASQVALRLAPGDSVPNKDFVLRYEVAGARPAFALLAHRDAAISNAPAADPDGAFFLMAQPPAAAAGAAVTPREVIFVLDTSSSMAGAPLAKARQLIRRTLAGLGADDTFQIVRFDDAASALGPRPLASRARNVTLATAWLDALVAGGGTEVVRGIDAALAQPHDPARLRVVVFLTDGFVGNEDEILASVASHMGEARLFCFGVGSAVNRYLLEELARIGRGTTQVVRADEDEAAAVERFHARLARPLLTDVRIDWKGLAVRDLSPAQVPDLFAGQPIILSGRYTSAGAATITVHGRQAGRAVSFDVPVTLPESRPDPAIATVWARARIADLSRAQLRGERPELRAEILRLALAHRLMTRYTAFVAVDTSRVTAGGAATRVDVPVEVPDAIKHPGGTSGGGWGGSGSGWGGGGSGSAVAYGSAGITMGMQSQSYSVGAASKASEPVEHAVAGKSYPMVLRSADVSSPAPAAEPAKPKIKVKGDKDPGNAAPSADRAGEESEAIVVKRALTKLVPVRACLDAAHARDPALTGKVVVEFDVGPTGVMTVRVLSSPRPDAALNLCLMGKGRTTAVRASSPTKVRVTFSIVSSK
ncbi:MAG: VWA domain-containing protein [Deltaproteobacteria bacterium]|nr:VWA domain-containing protein [Deltaproteobacteria bacterium]